MPRYISEDWVDSICDDLIIENILFSDIDPVLMEFVIRNSDERERNFEKWNKEQDNKKGFFSRLKDTAKNVEDGAKNFKQASDTALEHQKAVENDYKKVKKFGKVAGAVGLAMILKVAYDKYQKYKHGACAKVSGQDRIHCKIKAIDSLISDLNSRTSLCSKSNDPEHCRNSVKEKVSKLRIERSKLQSQL